MPLSPREVLTLVLALCVWIIAGLIWAVRLEGRIRLIERLVEDEIAASKQTSTMILTKLAAIDATLTKIRLTCAAFNHGVPHVGD